MKIVPRIVIVAAIFGLCLGFGLSFVKTLLKEELFNLLDSEVKASCDCEFKVSDISISFLKLKATALKPRILEKGRDALTIERLDAYFSLNELTNKKLLLTKLDLFGALAMGVGEDSPTYKFIDHLSAPLPPELMNEDRWRLILKSLYVHHSKFIEPVSDVSKIIGRGISMEMVRDAEDFWLLKPKISKLLYRFKTSNYDLGLVSSEVTIKDDDVVFSNLTLAKGNSTTETDAVASIPNRNALSGKASTSIDFSDYWIPESVRLKVTSSGSVEGRLAEPIIKGSIESKEATITVANEPLLNFQSLIGNHQVSFVKGAGIRTILTDLKAKLANGEFNSTSLVELTGDKLSGKFDFNISTLDFYGVSFKNFQGQAELYGDFSKPLLKINAQTDAISTALGDLPNANVQIDLSENEVTTQVKTNTQPNSFILKTTFSDIKDEWQLTNLQLEAKQIPLSSATDAKETTDESFVLTGSANIMKPVNSDNLEGKFDIRLHARKGQDLLVLKGVLDSSETRAEILTPNNAVGGNIKIGPSGKSTVSISGKDFKLATVFPGVTCSTVNFDLNYEFELTSPTTGTGMLNFGETNFGCAPFTINIKQSTFKPLQINAGNIDFSTLRLEGQESVLKLSGGLSLKDGWDTKAEGQVLLNALSGFLPDIDDLRGNAAITASISGPPLAPKPSGKVHLKSAEMAMESSELSVRKLSGYLQFDENALNIESVSGELNGGQINLSGNVVWNKLEKSVLDLAANKITIYPDENFSAILSGEFRLNRDSNADPILKGRIIVDSGEFQKEIDLQAILATITSRMLRNTKNQSTSTSSALTGLPELPIELEISARRNLFVITNWLGTELKGNIIIKGTLAAPVLSGSLEALSGWFGLQSQKFDITSAIITFRPSNPEPRIDLVSEAYIPSLTGEGVLVIIEARGDLSDPQIILSSDRGDPPEDILKLLTLTSPNSSRSILSEFGGDSVLRLDKPEDDSGVLIERFFRNIAKLDTLTIEPAYNLNTATIEPKVLAIKNLSDRLSLRGESFVGSTATDSRLELGYALTPDSLVSTGIESGTDRRNSAITANISLIILAQHKPFLAVSTTGNDSFTQRKLLNAIRVSETSRITDDDLGYIAERLQDFYISEGYFNAEIDLVCKEKSDNYCSLLEISIAEKQRVLIETINTSSEIHLDQILPNYTPVSLAKQQYATKSFKDNLRDQLTARLRSEGYIAARVDSVYSSISSNRAVLDLNVTPGRPVSFVFSGNSLFGPEEFLNSINLFKRKVPFGNNTINILVRNIERMYRQAGYLLIQVRHSQTHRPENADRLIYHIDITEGPKVPVNKVLFHITPPDSNLNIEKLLLRHSPNRISTFLQPDFAIDEELVQNVRTLREILREEGFEGSSVKYRLDPKDDSSEVTINYTIKLGKSLKADWLKLEASPEVLEKLPALPKPPYSITKANSFIETSLDKLQEDGYLEAEIWSELAESNNNITLFIERGEPTTIESIDIKGNINISEAVILENSKLESGQLWSDEVLNEARRSLLKLGLFSRVEIKPQDGHLNSGPEVLELIVTEKALQSLEIGTGVNSEYGIHFFGLASDKSLFKDGRGFALRLDAYYDDTSGEISQGVSSIRFSSPSIGDSDWRFAEELRYQKIDSSAFEYDLDRISLNTNFSRLWENGLNLSLGHSILEEDLTDVPADVVLSDLDQGITDLSYLQGFLGYDQRDNPLIPRNGFYLTSEGKLASDYMGSDASYLSVTGRASFVKPFWINPDRIHISNATKLGISEGFNGTEEIPISQRFYLGGRTSVRGFRENSLGPRGEDGGIIGGDLLFSNSFQVDYIIYNSISIHTFLDVGNVFLQEESNSINDLRYSSGLGASYLSPIGPIGLDLGFPLDEEPGEPSARLHFSIGSNF